MRRIAKFIPANLAALYELDKCCEATIWNGVKTLLLEKDFLKMVVVLFLRFFFAEPVNYSGHNKSFKVEKKMAAVLTSLKIHYFRVWLNEARLVILFVHKCFSLQDKNSYNTHILKLHENLFSF